MSRDLPAAVLVGVGSAVGERVVTNDDLAARLDTTDAWIRSRTGIRRRHVVEPGTRTSDLAVIAGAQALAAAPGVPVTAVVLATTTPDRPCPATAPEVAARLGLGTVPAFDLNAVCSGFLYGLAVARGLIATGAPGVLLIGADTYSTLMDRDDRGTVPLFGDGAGAAVLRAGHVDEPGAVLAVDLGSDGTQADLITVPRGGHFTMRGQEVYRSAVARMTSATADLLDRVGWTAADVDWFVGHQANQRILDAVAARLGLDADRVVSNVAERGNTAAASIPLALADAVSCGRLQPGDRIALAAFGGGTTWGAAALTWPKD